MELTLKELAGKINSEQEKNRKKEEKERKRMGKLVDELEGRLRKLPQFKGDCPICKKPTVVFGSKDYKWDDMEASKGYTNCVLSGSDVMHHDSCFFGRYGHLD